MQRGREEERESGGAEAVSRLLGSKRDGDAHGFEHVGGAAFRGDAAIAVLGDFGSGSGGDQCGAGGDVEGAEAIAAGSAGIEERGTLVVE